MSGPGMLQWVAPATSVVLAVLALALVVSLRRVRSGTERELEAARAESADLQARLAELENRLAAGAAPVPAVAEYVITHLGEDEAAPAGPQVDRALFADLVLRETVVKASALGHGLRRALAPETRNRIRFEMKREVKRARKQRRAELREARRDLAARHRATDAA